MSLPLEQQKQHHAAPRLAQLYAHLLAGDAAAVRALFPGPVALDAPLAGAVQGDAALNRFVEQQKSWLAERRMRVEPLSQIEDDAQAAVELALHWVQDGAEIDLPVALIGQKVPGGFGQVRVYHSTWPLHGKHAYRAPIVWPRGRLAEPAVVEAYFAALEAGDAAGMMATFDEDGYVREPSGSRYRHEGPGGRAAFYAMVTAQPGGVGLTHATATLQGRLFAVEYLCERWGASRFAPMAGCAFYELTADLGRIVGVRIYDDVSPPGE